MHCNFGFANALSMTIKKRAERYIAKTHGRATRLAESSLVSNATIFNLLHGKKLSDATERKIMAALPALEAEIEAMGK